MSDEKKIEAGTHKVKVTAYGIRETNSGAAQLWIRFSNGAHFFQMLGNNDIGDQVASEALVLCGFKGNDLADLFSDDALDKCRDIEIYVQYKPNSETGKPDMSVRINNPGKKVKGNLERKDALAKFKSLKLTLKTQIKDAKSDIGTLPEQRETKAEPKAKKEEEIDADEIPF